MTTLFNVLSILTALGVGVCLLYVRRLRTYVSSPSWSLKLWAFVMFFLAQVGGVINIYFYNGGLNWLGIANTSLRTLGIALLALGYAKMECTLKALFKKFRIKTTPVQVGQVDTTK